MIPLLQALPALPASPPTGSTADVLAWVCGGLVFLLSVEGYVVKTLFAEIKELYGQRRAMHEALLSASKVEVEAAALRERGNAEANMRVAAALEKMAATSDRCVAKEHPELLGLASQWLQHQIGGGGK